MSSPPSYWKKAQRTYYIIFSENYNIFCCAVADPPAIKKTAIRPQARQSFSICKTLVIKRITILFCFGNFFQLADNGVAELIMQEIAAHRYGIIVIVVIIDTNIFNLLGNIIDQQNISLLR